MSTFLRLWRPAGLVAGLLLVGSILAQGPADPSYEPDASTGNSQDVPSSNESPQPSYGPEDTVPPGLANQSEFQARGQVPEGFAQPAESTVTPGPSAPKAPPEPVQEKLPDQKPVGDNVVWIPGAWNWEADRADFVWGSGLWRVAPPGRKWVPGYWNQTDSSWQWVSGFWADAKANELSYVEPPPAPLETAATKQAPDENSFYIPGCWKFRDNRYQWRRGYWSAIRPGFVYCPPRYVWTPRGCLFVNGYWDWPLESRGVLFAPVSIPRTFAARRGWWYRPTYTVNLPAVFASLWVRSDAGCYAFGDYYDAGYARRGFQAWITYAERYRDPLFNYYGWVNRGNPAWAKTLLSNYRGRINGRLPRPPRTLAAQLRLATSRRLSADLSLVQPLSRFRSASLRLTRTTAQDRLLAEKTARHFHQASLDRHSAEGRPVPHGVRPAPLALHHMPGPTSSRLAHASPASTHSAEGARGSTRPGLRSPGSSSGEHRRRSDAPRVHPSPAREARRAPTARPSHISPARGTVRSPRISPARPTVRPSRISPAGRTVRPPRISPARRPARPSRISPARRTVRPPHTSTVRRPDWRPSRVERPRPRTTAWSASRPARFATFHRTSAPRRYSSPSHGMHRSAGGRHFSPMRSGGGRRRR